MSGIRPPSKIPAFAPGRELTELSASQNNARHAPAPGMAPPQVIGAKHKTSHGALRNNHICWYHADDESSLRASGQTENLGRSSGRAILDQERGSPERPYHQRRTCDNSPSRTPKHILFGVYLEGPSDLVTRRVEQLLRRKLQCPTALSARTEATGDRDGPCPHELVSWRRIVSTRDIDGAIRAFEGHSSRSRTKW